MLEIIRVLLDTKKQLKSPIIFNFNGAEELGMMGAIIFNSLSNLLGAHSFITQHPWATQ